MAKAVIIEVRAGTGGDEAALFAADLFNMYSKFAAKNGWKSSLIDANRTGLKGYKEITFEIKGEQTYEQLQQEAGVHRVQRIPVTEKSGRIHTSTVSVAVLPEVQEAEIKINPQDLRIETIKGSGPGGQYKNKTESTVRITHLPTGTTVISQEERNQQSNKEKAMAVLRARLMAKQREQEMAQRSAERREQIGLATRAEKVRTYNFPQNRITDHRIKKSWHNLDDILDGDLTPIIKAFQKAQNK